MDARSDERFKLNPVLPFALKRPGQCLGAQRADVLATVMLLAGNLPAGLLAAQGIEQGRFKLDSIFIQKLFTACPTRLKIVLATTPGVFVNLAPAVFEPLLQRALALTRSKPAARFRLLDTLAAFLARHPDQAERYRRPIMRSLQAPEQSVVHAALFAAACCLTSFSRKELSSIYAGVKRLRGVHQFGAVQSLLLLWVRRGMLGPGVEAFCQSAPILTHVRSVRRQSRHAEPRQMAAIYLRNLERPSRPRPEPPAGSTRTRLAWLMREPHRQARRS